MSPGQMRHACDVGTPGKHANPTCSDSLLSQVVWLQTVDMMDNGGRGWSRLRFPLSWHALRRVACADGLIPQEESVPLYDRTCSEFQSQKRPWKEKFPDKPQGMLHKFMGFISRFGEIYFSFRERAHWECLDKGEPLKKRFGRWSVLFKKRPFRFLCYQWSQGFLLVLGTALAMRQCPVESCEAGQCLT